MTVVYLQFRERDEASQTAKSGSERTVCLDSQVNMSHEVVRLSALIDWTMFNDRFDELYHTEVGWLKRNHLKGTESDSMNVMRNCAGHNLRLILKRLSESSTGIFCRSVFRWIFC